LAGSRHGLIDDQPTEPPASDDHTGRVADETVRKDEVTPVR
jgi:hypothetical protein